jgi:phage shock protein E
MIFALFFSLQEAEFTKDRFDAIQAALKEKKAVLLDVRERSEWEEDHLDSARHFALSALKDASAEDVEKTLPKKRIVYVHCRAGGRALRAAGLLKKLGYDARPLKAGYEDLKKAGF